ncbi:RadC family protein [Halodesulfovibrio marinisediminis]|uniref:DNA repair protein RadC n=1 Tax=Halodesulfovibrio marinisediminis DSM 17456 TaxID=1121457 RepID=A0A1N6DG47_9BACT|nr:DNA repair protein RadC [Halodesulfovibrio marinisediminis]SIN69760.1 DNA repair protein RadC [Halodesulfovibrio marinisediminis DSM 17456]
MTEKAHYHGHRKRLREKLNNDEQSLADYEILELVLGTVILRSDTKPLAKELLNRFGTLRGVLDAQDEDLLKLKGFGNSLVSHWKLLRELFSRYVESGLPKKKQLSSPAEVAEMARIRLGRKEKEEFWAAFLDNQNRLLSWERISTGTVNTTMIYPRELMEQALQRKASSLVIVHNHPGGNLTPSSPDIEITRHIVQAGRILGIRLLDHLIITADTYYSLKDEGHI